MIKTTRAPWRAKLALLFSAGALFQASGCSLDPNSLATDLFTTIGSNFIGTYVFGLFNLV